MSGRGHSGTRTAPNCRIILANNVLKWVAFDVSQSTHFKFMFLRAFYPKNRFALFGMRFKRRG